MGSSPSAPVPPTSTVSSKIVRPHGNPACVTKSVEALSQTSSALAVSAGVPPEKSTRAKDVTASSEPISTPRATTTRKRQSTRK